MNYFFEDYNQSYAESNHNTSALPFKNKSYYIKDDTQNKEMSNKNNNSIQKIIPWTLDSGTTYHMTGNVDLLDNKKAFNKKIFFANGDYVKSKYIGEFNGYINDNKISLKNILFIPEFKRNLMSVDCLTDSHFKTVFFKDNNINKVSIYNKNNNKLFTACSNNTKTYTIWTSKKKFTFPINNGICNYIADSDSESLFLWHKRLGHFNINNLRHILTKINTKQQCQICAKTKLKNFPFQQNDNRAKEPFELVHMDTVSITDESLYGNKYFLSILDDYSRFGWILFFKSKAEVFQKFISWYNMIKNIFGRNIKFLRTDNGTEFTNKFFEDFCTNNGIVHEFSIPYSPQQNGRIERLHGTLIPNARAILEEGKLNHVFWEDAVSTVNFIYNRIPHRGIGNSTPYELLYDNKVDFSKFRVFGCRVFFYVPKQFRKKLFNSALPGIFIGYDTNPSAYRIYDITNNKVILSRSVVFFEDIPGNCSAPSSPPELLNFTPYYEIEGDDIYNEDFQVDNYYNNNNNLNMSNNNYNMDNSKDSNNTNNTVNQNENKNNNSEYENVHNKNFNQEETTLQNNNYNNNNNNKSQQDEFNNINENVNENVDYFIDNNKDNGINNIPNTSNNIQNNNNGNMDENNNLTKRKFIDETEKLYKKFRITNNLNLSKFNEDQELDPPLNFNDIFGRPDGKKWLEAVENELNNMKIKKVYSVVKSIPNNKNLISSKWVFSYKRDDKGNIIKYKARLVARGFSQIYGVDYEETFSPTLKQDSLRIITNLSAYYNFDMYQLDIKAAYLNAEVEEELYMETPEGFENPGFWKLNKAIYGLKQAGRMWNNKINETLLKLGFTRTKSEPCVYCKRDNKGNISCILAIYVDDIIISGKKNEINYVKSEIKNIFDLSDIGPVDFIIGIKFIKTKYGYIMHQLQYLNKILEKFKIEEYNQISSLTYIQDEELRKRSFDPKKYMQAVGSLLYLAMGTRPDILFATSKASRKNRNPTYEDWINVIKIFRYLKGTKYYGLSYTGNINLDVYVDADLGGDEETKRSTTGFIINMGKTPICWYSKLQHCVSISTAESEYYSLNECALKCMWFKNFMRELNINTGTIKIKVDNKAAIYNSENETINPKSRHINLRYHKVRELVREKEIKLEYIKSENNLADGLTKYLNGPLLNKFRRIMLWQLRGN